MYTPPTNLHCSCSCMLVLWYRDAERRVLAIEIQISIPSLVGDYCTDIGPFIRKNRPYLPSRDVNKFERNHWNELGRLMDGVLC
jgi:hypothetical protein